MDKMSNKLIAPDGVYSLDFHTELGLNFQHEHEL